MRNNLLSVLVLFCFCGVLYAVVCWSSAAPPDFFWRYGTALGHLFVWPIIILNVFALRLGPKRQRMFHAGSLLFGLAGLVAVCLEFPAKLHL